MKIAAYIRVSTDKQTGEMQTNNIDNYCRFKGYNDVTLFKDIGESGSKKSRPQFDIMMKKARNKEFDAVLCWSFDRISRSTIQLVSLVEEFSELKIDFISLQQNIDTTSPVGKMIFTVFAAIAQFERETLRQRTISGQLVAKSKGIHCGRAETYDNNQREVVFAHYNEGMKPDKIADITKISRATVYRMIKSKK